MLRTLARQHQFQFSRTAFHSPLHAIRMSTSASPSSKKHEYIVILPDHPGVLQQRLRVRPDHLKNLNARLESGFWKLGGAILDEELEEGKDPKINGSVMMALAESKEEVLAALKEDVYSTSGVWDWEKATIHPFKSAFIRP